MRIALATLGSLFALSACGGSSTTTPDMAQSPDDLAPALPAWLSDSKILVPGVGVTNTDCRGGICQHNENTDLTTFGGAIYFVHRTAVSQILGPNSSLHIYRSDDSGAHFVEQAKLLAPAAGTMLGGAQGRDLRDPCFFAVGGTLYLKALTRLPVTSPRDSNVDTIAVESHSTDGKTWSELHPIGPVGFSFWRVHEHGGVLYTAAYHDGDTKDTLFTSTDGLAWTQGADIYTTAADTPGETELTFMPSGRLLALVRMDGTDAELLGGEGRLRTAVCWADAPYSTFTCPQILDGQRLDGPLSFFWSGRLFNISRKHISGIRKRTSLFEIGGTLEGGPLMIKEWGELPSAGDTAYAGVATIDDHRSTVTWYSGDLTDDESWIFGMQHATDIRQATIDFSKLK